MADTLHESVKYSVRRSAEKLLARLITVEEFLREIVPLADGAKDGETESPRELAAAARRERRKKMLAYFEVLKQKGHRRDAPKMVARKFARDPADQVEIESLARQIRRWTKIPDSVRALPANSDSG